MFSSRGWYLKMYLPDQIGAYHLLGKIKGFQEQDQSMLGRIIKLILS